MTLYQLKVFITVAKLKSYTLASRELGVRQPSVSLLIQGLERQFGIKLFDRLGNKVHLTSAGEELFHHGKEIIAKTEGIKEEIQELMGLKYEKISVGGSVLAGALFLVVAVAKFKNDHPKLEIILKVDKSESLERMLLEGDLDIAIMSRVSNSPHLVCKPYLEDEIVVIAPPDHPLTKKRSVPLELIAKEPLIIEKKGRLVRELVEKRFIEKRLPFAGALEVDAPVGSSDAIKSAVASGLGIGFISKCYVTGDVLAERMKLLHVPELQLKRTLYIAARKNRRDSSIIQAFIAFLRSHKEQQ